MNVTKFRFYLLCTYAFLLPFEMVLDVLLGIDTVLKPYRVIALAIIGISILCIKKSRLKVNKDFNEDLFLYVIFVYGIIITFYSMVSTRFGISQFFNDTFQIGLYLAVFIIIKNLYLTRDNWLQLFKSLIAGIAINALYIYNNFFIIRNSSRQSGFMDNPNFVGLATAVSILFLLMHFNQIRKFASKVIIVGILFILLSTFLVAGSRISLLVLVLGCLLVTYLGPAIRKLAVGLAIILAGFYFTINSDVFEGRSSYILVNRVKKTNEGGDPRFPLWRGAIRAAVATNFTGLGIGQFKARFGEFYAEEKNKIIRNFVTFGAGMSVHSDYFALLTEYGLIGMLSYIAFILLSLRKNWLHSKVYDYDYRLKLTYQTNFIILFSLAIFGLASESFISPICWFLLSISTKTLAV